MTRIARSRRAWFRRLAAKTEAGKWPLLWIRLLNTAGKAAFTAAGLASTNPFGHCEAAGSRTLIFTFSRRCPDVATGIRKNPFGFNHLLARARAGAAGAGPDRGYAPSFELARFPRREAAIAAPENA